MTKFLKLLLFSSLISNLALSSCSAPKPHKVSFSGKLKPVNFGCQDIDNSGLVIKSEQIPGFWREQFTYSIDDASHLPEFMYYVIHADKIIAIVKPPFVEFVFEKVKANLRSYGATASIELLIDEGDINNDAQVVLECIRYKN